MANARDDATWRTPDNVWLDHATLKPSDAEWLAPAKTLTLWAVKVPDGLLASLPHLEFLDVRGGSGTTVDFAAGCTRLRYLQVNQVRGVTDLTVIPTLTSLELLSLYGLPKVADLPSFAPLTRLNRVELGSLKGLQGLGGLHDAPALEELLFSKVVEVTQADAQTLAKHPTLEQFSWFAVDAPLRLSKPFTETLGKPNARFMHAHEWFALRDAQDE